MFRLMFIFITLMLFTNITVAEGDFFLRHTLPHDGTVLGAVWKPDNSQIASWDANSIYLWDVKTGQQILKFGMGSPNCVYSNYVVRVGWSRDEQRIFCAVESNHTVQVWDANTGEEILQLDRLPETDWLFYTWNFDATQLLVCCHGVFELWDMTSGQILNELPIDAGPPDFSRNGSQILIPSENKVYIWDISSDGFAVSPSTTIELNEDVFTAAWNEAASRVLIQMQMGNVESWSLKPLKKDFTIDFRSFDSSFYWSPDEQFIYGIAGGGLYFAVYDASTGKLRWVKTSNDEFYYLYWSMSHPNLIYGTSGESVQILDAETGQPLVTLPTGFVRDVQPTLDDKYVLTWNGGEYSDNNISIWDMQILGRVFLWEPDFILRGAWLSPDDTHFIGWGEQNVYVWEFPPE